jgi:2,4-dienoyl-CoA reductase (NADPH2)
VVVTDPDGARRTIPADVVALAIGWRPTGADLAVPAGVEVRVLGDAEEAADFVRAVNTGADAGLAV